MHNLNSIIRKHQTDPKWRTLYKITGCDLKKCQGHESQRQTAALSQTEVDWRDVTTKCSVWFWIGSLAVQPLLEQLAKSERSQDQRVVTGNVRVLILMFRLCKKHPWFQETQTKVFRDNRALSCKITLIKLKEYFCQFVIFKKINGNTNTRKQREERRGEERRREEREGKEDGWILKFRPWVQKALFSYFRFPRRELCNSNGRIFIVIAWLEKST